MSEEVPAICEKCGREFGKIQKGERAGYCPECATNHAKGLTFPIAFHLHAEENTTSAELKELGLRLLREVPYLQVLANWDDLQNRKIHLILHK